MGAPTCPVLLLPARLSSRPPPQATSDEGAEGRIELFRRSRKSLAPHLGARRGGAVRRSELGRRINGVSELLLSTESIFVDLHFFFDDVFTQFIISVISRPSLLNQGLPKQEKSKGGYQWC